MDGSSTNSMFHPQSDMKHFSEFSASRQSRALSGHKNNKEQERRTRGEKVNLGKIQESKKVRSFFFLVERLNAPLLRFCPFLLRKPLSAINSSDFCHLASLRTHLTFIESSWYVRPRVLFTSFLIHCKPRASRRSLQTETQR